MWMTNFTLTDNLNNSICEGQAETLENKISIKYGQCQIPSFISFGFYNLNIFHTNCWGNYWGVNFVNTTTKIEISNFFIP